MSMSKTFKCIVESDFTNKELVNTWLSEIRWPDGKIVCPRCQYGQVSISEEQKMPYWCKACRLKFSIQTGILMEASRIPPHKWVKGCYHELMSLSGISSLSLAKVLKITQPSAWAMLDRIRGVLAAESPPNAFKNGLYFRVDELWFHDYKFQKKVSGNSNHSQAATKNMVTVVITHLKSQKVWIEVVAENELEKVVKIVERVIPKTGVIFSNEESYSSKLDRENYLWDKSKEFFDQMGEVNEDLYDGLKNLREPDWSELISGILKIHRRVSNEHLTLYVRALAGRNNLRGMTSENKLKYVLTTTVKKS